MPIQFITGDATCNHEEVLLKQAHEFLTADPQHNVYYLVPNFVKFEKEISSIRQLATLDGNNAAQATLRFKVCSFERLAWYLLGESMATGKEYVTENGLHMIVRKVLQEEGKNLHLFKGEASKTGFITQILELFHEFHQGDIEISEIVPFLEKHSENKAIAHKFEDILRIFKELSEKIASYNVQTKTEVDLLIENLETIDLTQTMIFVSGYTRFSSKELLLMEQFMCKAKKLTLAIVTEKVESHSPILAMDLFENGKNLYQTLYSLARKNECPILTDVHLTTNENTRISLLATTFLQLHQGKKVASNLPAPKGLTFTKCPTLVSEIESVAKKIHHLVVNENYRYKDIQVLTRDFETMTSVLPAIFSANDLPYTIGSSEKMKHHPLVEFLQSLFDVKKYHYRNADVFRLLRSELLVPFFLHKEGQTSLFDETEKRNVSHGDWLRKMQDFREDVDICENVTLQFGYDRRDWINGKEWSFVSFDYGTDETEKEELVEVTRQNRANAVRAFICEVMQALNKAMDTAKDAQTGAKNFYSFLEKIGLMKQFLLLRNHVSSLEKKRNYEQIWDTFIRVLDEYVTIFGEDAFDFEEFKEIFETGVLNESFGKIPATLDAVQVKNMDLAESQQSPVVFLVGMNHYTLPVSYENTSILTLEERELFCENLPDGKFFFNDTRIRSNQENFLAYTLLLSAKEKLYISYSENIDGQKDIHFSPLFEKVRKAFSLPFIDKSIPLNKLALGEIIQNVSTPRALVRDLVKVSTQAKENQEILSSFWIKLTEFLRKSSCNELFHKVSESLGHENIPTNLETLLADKLYGNQLEASVSRFERYFECAYKHFASYGLRLTERQILTMNPASVGNYFHEAMDLFFKKSNDIFGNVPLAELTEEERQYLQTNLFNELAQEKKFALLHKNPRLRYLQYQLNDIIQNVLWATFEQAKRTPLTTKKTELVFGKLAGVNGIKSPTFLLQNGKEVMLRGKIDRIDTFIDATTNQEYLAVIDYKSRKKAFDIVDSYYGLSMQMLTYLDVALKNDPAVLPIGAYYFHLQNPVLDFKENPESEQLKNFRMNGLTVEHNEALMQLDHTKESFSSVFPIKHTKNGVRPASKDAFFAEDGQEFDVMRKANEENFKKAATEIFEGSIPLNPIRCGKEPRACSFCPFKSLCQFDPMLKENNYIEMISFDKNKKEGVLKAIKNGLDPRKDSKQAFLSCLKSDGEEEVFPA